MTTAGCTEAARRAIAQADIVWVSAVSAWEVAIKVALGRLRLDEPFKALIAADDFTELPLTLAHTERLAGLAAAPHRSIRPHARLAGAGRARDDREPRPRARAVRRVR